jgi:hypothetical protein
MLFINRHVLIDGTDAFFDDAPARLRSAAPRDGGHRRGAVPRLLGREDSHGLVERSRAVTFATAADAVAGSSDMQMRTEPAPDEAYIHLTLKEMSWTELLPAYDALGLWIKESWRHPPGPHRQPAARHARQP